jgi:hypothetical protein
MVPFVFEKRLAALISREVEVKALHKPIYLSSNFLLTPLNRVIPFLIFKSDFFLISLKHAVKVLISPLSIFDLQAEFRSL